MKRALASCLLASCGPHLASSAPCPATPAISAAMASPPSAPASQVAEPAPLPFPAAFDVATLDAYLAQQTQARGYVGLSVAVVKDGTIVLAKAYGLASITPAIPATPDTLFAAGSITKQFTSSAALLLAEKKKLSFSDPIAKYYPDLTRARDITVHDVATHVSGYADDYPLDYVDREMQIPITADEEIARYGKRPLDFEPRTRWSYTGTGYFILGRIVERASGQALGALYDERFFRPLGMDHTVYNPKPGDPRVAVGYTSFALGAPEIAEPEAAGWHFGAGGIFTTATDLAKWDVALMSGKVLSPRSYETLTTARKLVDGRSTGYGCGISVHSHAGDVVLEHDGGQAGFYADSAMAPRARDAVVVLTNRDGVDASDLVWDILALMLDEQAPRAPVVAGPSLETVARELFSQMQAGKMERERLGDDFNAFLTDAKVAAAAPRLRAYGSPTRVQVRNRRLRGGMEQSLVVLSFGDRKLEVSVFRRPDGRVEQFLVGQ
jgi:D-alanyl-D-alanine carboxypeptidase